MREGSVSVILLAGGKGKRMGVSPLLLHLPFPIVSNPPPCQVHLLVQSDEDISLACHSQSRVYYFPVCSSKHRLSRKTNIYSQTFHCIDAKMDSLIFLLGAFLCCGTMFLLISYSYKVPNVTWKGCTCRCWAYALLSFRSHSITACLHLYCWYLSRNIRTIFGVAASSLYFIFQMMIIFCLLE